MILHLNNGTSSVAQKMPSSVKIREIFIRQILEHTCQIEQKQIYSFYMKF